MKNVFLSKNTGKFPEKNIKIHDTTLRDGEQMPGVVLKPEEKLILAGKFLDFGVDMIDIMPSVSEREAMLARELVAMDRDKISATCRLKKEDIDQAIELGVKQIVLFTPLSDIHLEYKLKISRGENIRRACEFIDYAKEHGLTVDLAGEDSTRADMDYLLLFIKSIDSKIRTFFVADTVGCLTPKRTYSFISALRKKTKCKIGLHIHNDFAMATANTLEGLRAGADVFSGTFTGIGERAGNAPIEEVCTALKYLYDIYLDVKYSKIKEICDLVEKFSGVALQAHKPIVGKNAFCHESGIHADGVIKNPRTYEFIDPEDIGHERRFSFGKHSGRNVIKHVIDDASESEIDDILKKIKHLSESEKITFTEDDVTFIFKECRKMVQH